MTTSLSQQLQKAVQHLKSEFMGLQIGRASAALVEEIQIESYGSLMALKASANISCPDSKTVKIEPWDKSLFGAIEKAILASSLGLNPQNMGTYLLLPIPPLTEERRKQIVKLVHEMAEQCKISIRQVRQEALKDIKHQKDDKAISEDEYKKKEKDIQEQIDQTNKEIEGLTGKKEKEVLTV